MSKVTAGRDELGSFAPKFAKANDTLAYNEIYKMGRSI